MKIAPRSFKHGARLSFSAPPCGRCASFFTTTLLLPTAPQGPLLVLGEKRPPAPSTNSIIEPWRQRRRAFANLTPALPKCRSSRTKDGTVVSDQTAITEYLDERYPDAPLIGRTPVERAEVRRLSAWFDQKFNREVTQHIAGEKLLRRISANAAPDSRALYVRGARICRPGTCSTSAG